MKFVALMLSVIVLVCAAGSLAQAQGQVPRPLLGQTPPVFNSQDTSNSADATNGTATVQSMDQLKLKANFQLELTILVAIFGIIGLIFVAMMFRSTVAADTEKIVRLVIVVIVVTASLILIAGGYSTDQTAPAFGLFGSIIGYILGSAARPVSGTGTTPDSSTTATAGTPPSGGAAP